MKYFFLKDIFLKKKKSIKTLLIMKTISILSFICLFNVTASVYSQNTKLNIDVRETSVREVFKLIESQTEFRFFFNDDFSDLNRKVTIDAKEKGVEDILQNILMDSDVSYRVLDNNLIVIAPVSELKQGISISGTITDESGEPIPGVNITIKGTLTGVISDIGGKYSITAPNRDAVLQYSFIGYIPQEVTIGDRNSIDILLAEDVREIEEVVVVGYGTARKGDLTGSISSVQGDKLTSRSTQHLSTALQGQISGVQVTRNSGQPGASATVRVRGITTLSNNDPLVIVDGVPSSLNDVLANDVETMTVLKDAASASIYGSRAAAGVILITTKRAKERQFTFDYNYEYGIDRPTAKPKNGNVIDWMNMQNEVKWNDGASDPYSMYSQQTIDSWLSNNATDPWHYPNTNWVDLILKKTTSHQQHSVSVSGGTEKLLTKFTFNYQKGDGYYDFRSYERFAGRVNNDYRINSWLRANIDIDFSKSEAISPAVGTIMDYAYQASPYYTATWADGRYADAKDGFNPLGLLKQGGTRNENYYKFGGKAQLDITPLDGLTLTAIYAPRFAFTNEKRFARAAPLYYENGTSIFTEWNKSTYLEEKRNNNNSSTFQFYANYQNKWGDHSLNAMAGYEGYSYQWEDLGAARRNYLLNTYPYLNIGPEDYQYNSGKAGHNAYESAFARLIYSYKNKYIIQGNVRTDGSSRFAKDFRWGTFYSGSAGWVMSEESWFKDNINAVNYLKLRGSIGQLGNERIGSEFPYQAAISFGNSYMYNKSDQSVTALQNAAQVYYAFENITWETTTTYGLGLDITLLNNRLRFTGDWYHKKTADMLLELGFPSYAGFSAPQQNAGDMYTNGWDIEIGWSDTMGDFWYNVSANLSDYRSKMGYLGNRRTMHADDHENIDFRYKYYEEGSYYNEWFMYKSAGLFQTDADLVDASGNKYPTLTANDKAGNIKYVDVDNSGTINADDKRGMGNSLPEYIYGGNISMGWKRFDFNLSFQGVGHQRVRFNSHWIQPLRAQHGAVPSLLIGNHWSQHNTPEQNLSAKYPRVTFTNTTNTYATSDYWLFNGAYFRVKNITLGYTLPSELMNKVKIKDLRCYFSIYDLPAISKYPKGWDPEVGATSDFISTSFIFGVNVKF